MDGRICINEHYVASPIGEIKRQDGASEPQENVGKGVFGKNLANSGITGFGKIPPESRLATIAKLFHFVKMERFVH